MRRFIWAGSYIAGGVAAGCLSAFVAIQSSGVEEAEAGAPWLSRSAALMDQQAFYVRAHYLISGRLPPAPGQIIEATAETDSDGRPLTGACAYRITSAGPLPVWWSLSITGGSSIATDAAAAPLQSTADSGTSLRQPDGTVEIVAHPSPQPGNWLKSPTTRRFSLLYSALPQGAGATPPWTIRREGCP